MAGHARRPGGSGAAERGDRVSTPARSWSPASASPAAADWLDRRWQEGGPKLKQLAIATRADGLTLPQFLERWRGRTGPAGAAPIPDAYRGLASVQNHPLVNAGRDWAYDAINEVYFDDADSLLARIAYLERELAGGADSDLVRANWFLAVSEDPIRLPL